MTNSFDTLSFYENQIVEVLVKHFGDEVTSVTNEDTSTYIMRARKFCEFYHAGRDKFAFAYKKKDTQILLEMLENITKISMLEKELSFFVQEHLNFLINTEFTSEPDSLDPDDNDVGCDRLLAILDQSMTIMLGANEEDGIDSNVSWAACTTALLAKFSWTNLKGLNPPKTVHADTLGPFGEFLEDLLEVLAEGFPNHGPQVSARSAMRALDNITSKGVKRKLDW